ncbi:hypothetical protein BT93_K1650 [Corymbia citriodora subsp. variegata]|nr:hypothetical protein BT93_K1650 [Corymbia citriodora subsp. variegata]
MNEVKQEESFVPPVEDEPTEVKHLLEEPENDYFSVDGVFCSNEEDAGKFLDIKDFDDEVEFSLRATHCGLDSYITPEGGDALNLGGLDGILDEVDDMEVLDSMDGPAIACEDYLLDMDLAQEVSALDVGLRDGPRLGNSSTDSHSPGYSGSSNGAIEMSESSDGNNPELNCNDDSSQGRIGPEDCNCLSRDSIKVDQLQNSSDCVVSLLSSRNKNNPAAESRMVACLTQKRQRKPTRRYIEESANMKSSHLRPEQKPFAVSSKKHVIFRTPDQVHDVESRELTSVPVKDCPEETSIKTLPHPQLQGRRLKKREPPVEDDLGEYSSEFEDDFVGRRPKKGIDRRKHQRMWTLAEVTKLVDGISEYGAGKWTDIKRLFFATSAYRTPIDLRDKWRNLLRASHALKSHKGEAEKEKNAVRPLPKSLLRRVRELATIHPYPRNYSSRSRPVPTAKKGASLSSNGRNVRRRICP